MSRTSKHAAALLAAAGLALLGPSSLAQAASSLPAVRTGGSTKVTATTARIVGGVTPNGAVTSYRFQYGPTSLYGNATTIAGAGNGSARKTVAVDLAGLTPATTYHYRLFAHNRNGDVSGSDRTFKTRAQPLALSLAASPNPVAVGRPLTLAGVLSGTNNAGRAIQLQASPFPHAAGFANVAVSPVVADAQGRFALTLLSVALNTQYRVVLIDKPEVVSPIVGVGVQPRVSTHVGAHRVRRGGRVRFSGTVRPARTGQRIVVQRRRRGHYVYVSSTHARHGGKAFSRYATRVRITRAGHYRVLVDSSDGRYAQAGGRSVSIRLR